MFGFYECLECHDAINNFMRFWDYVQSLSEPSPSDFPTFEVEDFKFVLDRYKVDFQGQVSFWLFAKRDKVAWFTMKRLIASMRMMNESDFEDSPRLLS